MKKLYVFLLCILAASSVSACNFEPREAVPSALPEEQPEAIPEAGEENPPEDTQSGQGAEVSEEQKSLIEQMDRLAEQAAAALEKGEFSLFTEHCVHEYMEPTDYMAQWEGLKVKSADVVPLKQVGSDKTLGNPLSVYELTLMVDEAGSSSFEEGQSIYIMEIASWGEGSFQIQALVPKEKWQVQYPWYLDKRGTDPQLQVQYLRSFFDVYGFASPEELTPEALLYSSIYYACIDDIPLDELERTAATKEQVDEAGKRHFGILKVTELSESLAEALYSPEEGTFRSPPLEGSNLNQRLVSETKQQDGTVSCTFELYQDSLQTIPVSSFTYTLSPNSGVWQFLYAVENPLGEE